MSLKHTSKHQHRAASRKALRKHGKSLTEAMTRRLPLSDMKRTGPLDSMKRTGPLMDAVTRTKSLQGELRSMSPNKIRNSLKGTD